MLTLPVSRPRRRPRPLAADKRDAHQKGWAKKGAQRFGRGRGNSQLQSVNLGRGGTKVNWASQVFTLQAPIPFPAPSLPPPSSPSGAVTPGRERCAFPGLVLCVLEALTWVHGRPRPRPAGNFPDLLASIAAVAAAGWLRECARVRGCRRVRLCVCPATGQAGSAVRLLQSPALHVAARRCERLTGGCVVPTFVEPPPSDPRAPHQPREAGAHAAIARGAGVGNEPVRLVKGPEPHAARWC